MISRALSSRYEISPFVSTSVPRIDIEPQVLQGYKNMIPNFDSFLSQLPANVPEKLRSVYQI